MATIDTLLTAEEYGQLPGLGVPTELVRGKVVEMNLPAPRHGQVCMKVAWIVNEQSMRFDAGHVLCNDSGVITERDPDTVRGADVAFFSYQRLPRGPLPNGYLAVVPNVAFEVRSPSDRWKEVLGKVGEFLDAGVDAVCVVDPPTETLHIHYADKPPQVLRGNDELVLPEIHSEFRVSIRRFFE